MIGSQPGLPAAEPLRVLVVHNHYQRRGGEDAVVAAELELLAAMSVDVRTMFYDSRDAERLDQLMRHPSWLVFNREAYAEARARIREQAISLVHCHNLFPLLSTSIYAAAHAEGVPVIQTVHNYRMGCLNGLLLRNGELCERCRPGHHLAGVLGRCYRQSYLQSLAFGVTQTINQRAGTWRRPTLYIAPGEGVRTRLRSWGIPAEKIALKPHFVPADPGPRPPPGRHALFVGRLAPEKGIDLLLDVWGPERPPLAIVGEGPLRPHLERRVRSEGRTNVQLLGQLDRTGVNAQLHQARFLVLPSLSLETFGLVVIEAFAHGVPVVATRLGAMTELVNDGVNGLLFARDSRDDLGEKLDALEADPSRALAMGRAARSEYERRYSLQANAAQLRAAYAQALACYGAADDSWDDLAAEVSREDER